MSERSESPNPYEPPQTKASPETFESKKLESVNQDYKHQTIGFVVLTLTCAIGLVVGIGAAYFADSPLLGLGWNWKKSVFAGLSVVLLLPSAPGLLVCGCWTLFSASQWMVHADANRITPQDPKP